MAGIVLLGLAYLMRPRFGKLPTEGIVEREKAPTLHALVDEVATALGLRTVDQSHRHRERQLTR